MIFKTAPYGAVFFENQGEYSCRFFRVKLLIVMIMEKKIV